MTTKSAKPVEAAPQENTVIAQPAVTEIPMTVAEYCAHRSSGDKRVELISAFFNVTNGNGMARKTKTEFDAAFEKFCNAPA